MTPSPLTPTTTKPSPQKPISQAWYRPTFSPEHGVYIGLLVSFLSGAALALDWTWTTTLAFIFSIRIVAVE